jgi:pyruvate dehydrogenase E2 component (dihydrolipoamide acetyltransferase)
MPVTISMPQLGETVTEGTILEWVKQVGDHVAEDEVIVEISTDKVDTEVPSPASGILTEILVPAGETVAVGTALAVLGDADDAPAAAASAPAEETPAPVGDEAPRAEESGSQGSGSEGSVVEVAVTEVANVSAPAHEASAPTEPPAASDDAPRRGVLSPVVRKLASEHGIDLDQVRGSGDGGRITRKDVEAFAAGAAPAGEAAVADEPPSPAPPTPQVRAPQASAPAGQGSDVRDIPRMRQRIAANLRTAKDTAAHVWTSVEVDFENVERVRQRHGSDFKATEGYSLTYLPFIARATMDALSGYPVVNSRFELDAGTWTFNRSVNLGIAVDLNQDGLVVVNIRDADAMTLKGLARSIRAMAVAARDGKAVPDDLAGFSFSITNPGPFGSFMSAPIIPVPNAAILSTDTVTKKPVVVELPDGSDAIAIRHIGYLGLSWDHRVFDGSTAVLFLDRIRKNLQEWDWEQELS